MGGVSRWLEKFFGQMTQVGDLARAEQVARLVPASAEYVSCGPVCPVADAVAFNHAGPGQGHQQRDLGFLGPDQRVGLLVLADGELSVLEAQGRTWSRPVTELTDVDAHWRAGFLVFCRDGTGLALGTQTPVQVPPGARFGTPRGMTNAFCGWDAVLGRYGVRHHF